jgi:hypothetical protein
MTSEPPQEIEMFVDVESIFPGTPTTTESLHEVLVTLSRDDTLFYCARINIQVSGQSLTLHPMDRQRRALEILRMPSELTDRLNQFARTYNVRDFSIFFRGQLLELARHVATHGKNLPGDGNTFNDAKVRIAFFKAALIASGLWSRRVYRDRLADEGTLDVQLHRALGAFRKGVEESTTALDAGIAMGRAWLFFGKYLPVRFASFADAFRLATGLTVEQYFICATWILRYSFPDSADGSIFPSEPGANRTTWRKIFSTFLGQLSQDPESLATSVGDNDQTGYRSLRERPILTFSGGRSIILDPTFYTDTITTSPLFHAVKNVDKPRALFAAFGYAFEDYAIDFLKARYPDIKGLPGEPLRPRLHGRTAIGEKFEVDAIVNEPPSLVIMEMKAAWIREDTILTDDHEDFLRELRLKYGYITGSEERPKGVAQLAKVAGAIARGEWAGVGQEFAAATEIYPVLTVHDEKLAAPGLGSFLDQEFRSLLGEVSGSIRVHSLIVMTISDLETLTSSQDPIDLVTFLREYSSANPERMRSVHNFAAIAPRYADKWSRNLQLRVAFDALIEAARAKLFPPKETP